MRGAVAGGSAGTINAGLYALRRGGNAVDAAVASTLMAGVAEPLLSGLGGSGIATVRFGGTVFTVDFFANMPGLQVTQGEPSAMDEVRIDYGPTTQRFLVGKGSAAVPGLPEGMWSLVERFCRLSMEELAVPAIDAAQQGVEVSAGFERVLDLLWPILDRSAGVRSLFSLDGQPLRKGQTFRCPALAETLKAFSSDRNFFKTGPGATEMVNHVTGHSHLSLDDFEYQSTDIRPALAIPYKDSTVWVPGVPSIASLRVASSLLSLSTTTPPENPVGIEAIERLSHALSQGPSPSLKPFLRDFFTDGFGDAFVARLKAMNQSIGRISPGYTTHISTVDGDGNAVGITHSLGETAGELAGDSGILINNFLGEEDVNPPHFRRPHGGRLITMCCPAILEQSDGRVIAFGSGGSSRIPTAIVHGVSYAVDYGWSLPDAVRGPRTHLGNSTLHIESEGRNEEIMAQAKERWPEHVRFDGPNMFFGGLHTAAVGPDGFTGSGDLRRSGEYSET